MNNNPFKAINVRPYGPGHELECLYPALELVYEDQDFLDDGNLENLAVVLKVWNYNYGDASYIPKNENFVAGIYDGDVMLVQRTFSLKLYPWQMSMNMRIDIPIEFIQIEHETPYEVRISKKGSKKALLSYPIRFFPMKYHPEEAYSVEFGCLMDEKVPYRNIGLWRHDSLDVCFRVKKMCEGLDNVPEMLITIYDTAGESETLEGEIEKIGDDEYEVRVPFEDSSTRNGAIYAELRMLGFKVGGFVFSTDEEKDEAGMYVGEDLEPYQYYDKNDGIDRVRLWKWKKEEMEKKSVHNILNSLVGLENVKTKTRDYEDLVRFNSLRKAASLPYSMPPLHTMFMGSPGTGKTTVAKIMGKLLKGAGVLSKGHVVVRERATLLGQNYSSESENTLSALREAKGGILFIDEAYQLYQPNDPKDPGKFVIETLLTALADEEDRDWMLILAGYTDKMYKMMEMNPGLASRIPESNIYVFDDYSPNELLEIAHRYFETNNYQLTEGAEQAIKKRINLDYENREPNFGNARHVMNLIQTDIIPAMARRVMTIENPSTDILCAIQESDIPKSLNVNKINRQRVGFATR